MKEGIGFILGFLFIYFGFIYEFKLQIIGIIVILFLFLNIVAFMFKLKEGVEHYKWFTKYFKSKKSIFEWSFLPFMMLFFLVDVYQQKVLKKLNLV